MQGTGVSEPQQPALCKQHTELIPRRIRKLIYDHDRHQFISSGDSHLLANPTWAEQISELATEHKVGVTGPDFCEVLVHNRGENED